MCLGCLSPGALLLVLLLQLQLLLMVLLCCCLAGCSWLLWACLGTGALCCAWPPHVPPGLVLARLQLLAPLYWRLAGPPATGSLLNWALLPVAASGAGVLERHALRGPCWTLELA